MSESKSVEDTDCRYPLINNPFVKLDSFAKPRISLQKDPINKRGNTDYTQFYETSEGVILENDLDPKLNYFISNTLKEKEPVDMIVPLDESMLDYCISAETLNSNRTDGKELHKDPLPLSFLNIKTEEEGLLWYRRNYPKIPDDLLPIIARYHWGANINKDTIKKEKKKNKKKQAPITMSLETRDANNPFILDFN